MADTPSHTEIEAQIAASEARASTRLAEALGEMRTGFADVRTGFADIRTGFAEVRGDIAKLATRVEALERYTAGIKTTVIATGIAAVAVIITVLAYGQTWFGIGVSTRDVIRATVAEMAEGARPAPRP